jgi:hypothetical protein
MIDYAETNDTTNDTTNITDINVTQEIPPILLDTNIFQSTADTSVISASSL